jgi:hypothetical protein
MHQVLTALAMASIVTSASQVHTAFARDSAPFQKNLGFLGSVDSFVNVFHYKMKIQKS